MKFAEVIGNVVCSVKDPGMPQANLLLIQPLDKAFKPSGTPLVATDTVSAGDGEIVMFVTGSSARMTDATWEKPIDTTIIGIVDEVVRSGKSVFKK